MDLSSMLKEFRNEVVADFLPGAVAIYFVSIATGHAPMVIVRDALAGAPELQTSAVALVLAFSIIAWLVGSSLSQISHFPEAVSSWLNYSNFSVIQQFAQKYEAKQAGASRLAQFIVRDPFVADIESNSYTPETFLWRPIYRRRHRSHPYVDATYKMHDWLGAHRPELAARAIRILTEGIMLRKIALVSYVAIPLHIATWWVGATSFNWLFIGVSAAAAIAATLAVGQKFSAFQWLVVQQYYAIRSAEPARTTTP
ncbi:MAG: hypothetical protein M3328_13555 [Chloroflexota bacterium]|nr:hypothetical protein [Chloroflexota bacterium]